MNEQDRPLSDSQAEGTSMQEEPPAKAGWLRRQIGNWRESRQRDKKLLDMLDAAQRSNGPEALAGVILRDQIKERRRDRQWVLAKRLGLSLFFLAGLVYYILVQAQMGGFRWMPSSDLVGLVRIEGSIMNNQVASAEKVIPVLKKAFESPNVKAVILSIDSPGGAPLEAERINFMIDELRKEHPKPVYAVIQNVGASAGYMIALRADKIYAGRYSMVGSVGAVMGVWNVHKAAEKLNVEQKVYASGKLKAMLNPFLPVTPQAEHKAQEIVDEAGHTFMEEVKAKRGDKLQAGIEYNTGEVWSGTKARDLGLVDEIGTTESVAEQVKNAKVWDFGPGGTTRGLFSSVASDVLESLSAAVRDGIRASMTQSPTLQ